MTLLLLLLGPRLCLIKVSEMTSSIQDDTRRKLCNAAFVVKKLHTGLGWKHLQGCSILITTAEQRHLLKLKVL